MDKTQFAQQVREALQNLHDFAALQNLALIRAIASPTQTLDGSVRGLRANLIEAIETLRPGNALSSRSKEARPYHLMYGRYVQGMSTTELVEELAISVRQLRREHKRALSTVIDLLWTKFAPQLPPARAPLTVALTPDLDRREAAQEEVTQLVNQARIEEIEPLPLLRGLLKVLVPVAAKFGVIIHDQLPTHLPSVRADRVILRQGLLEILSNAIHHAVGGQLLLEGGEGDELHLNITATGSKAVAERTGLGLDVGKRLLASMGGEIEIVADAEKWQAFISLPAATDMSILVLDDNPGLIHLFRRYLADQRISLIEAHTAAETIAIAAKKPLRLAILDIMMPEQDGWEVLQQLRLAPETSHLPIAICSVLNEPEIAYGLGASAYLPKPVSQDAFLTLVEEWCALRLPPVATPATRRANSPTHRSP